mgnify:CR=1 FL=1
MFARTAWLVLRKDLRVEIRSLEIAYTTLFFAVSCVLVFAFALVREGEAPADGAAGILWIAISFAGTLALGRTFERERYGETLRALLLAPAPRPARARARYLAPKHGAGEISVQGAGRQRRRGRHDAGEEKISHGCSRMPAAL